MILIAVVWFVAGYIAGYIYFYPPILAAIGVYGVVKGIADGNFAGRRTQRGAINAARRPTARRDPIA